MNPQADALGDLRQRQPRRVQQVQRGHIVRLPEAVGLAEFEHLAGVAL